MQFKHKFMIAAESSQHMDMIISKCVSPIISENKDMTKCFTLSMISKQMLVTNPLTGEQEMIARQVILNIHLK